MNKKLVIQAMFVACLYMPLSLVCMEDNDNNVLAEEISQRFKLILEKNKKEIQVLRKANKLYVNKYITDEAKIKANSIFKDSKKLLREGACKEIVGQMIDLKNTAPEHYDFLCNHVLFLEGSRKSKLIKKIEKSLLNIHD